MFDRHIALEMLGRRSKIFTEVKERLKEDGLYD